MRGVMRPAGPGSVGTAANFLSQERLGAIETFSWSETDVSPSPPLGRATVIRIEDGTSPSPPLPGTIRKSSEEFGSVPKIMSMSIHGTGLLGGRDAQ